MILILMIVSDMMIDLLVMDFTDYYVESSICRGFGMLCGNNGDLQVHMNSKVDPDHCNDR